MVYATGTKLHGTVAVVTIVVRASVADGEGLGDGDGDGDGDVAPELVANTSAIMPMINAMAASTRATMIAVLVRVTVQAVPAPVAVTVDVVTSDMVE